MFAVVPVYELRNPVYGTNAWTSGRGADLMPRVTGDELSPMTLGANPAIAANRRD